MPLTLSRMRIVVLSVLSGLLNPFAVAAQDPQADLTAPNILWITSEDNGADWLGCYGNPDADTPRLDALAEQSTLFENAFSNAPVCAVARCTLLTGCYAPTLGTQHMRSRYPIPQHIRTYVDYLRAEGYYCTNRSKTDYNFAGNDQHVWDECSATAHYRNRPAGQPFFAIFNITRSHESSLFPDRVQADRKRGRIPETPRLRADQVSVPPYLPDLPETRADIAIYHDTLTSMDQRVGELLDELEHLGLSDDTIVFYFSDHGGPLPRGKRYLLDTGVRIPLLIHVPRKWRGISPYLAGQRVDEPVAFVDFAPTLLSLCGMAPPSHMQGRPFLGPHRQSPAPDTSVWLFADRFDGTVGMRRGIRDRRFKYVRRFTPHLPAAPYSQYSLGVPSWIAWRQAWQQGSLPNHLGEIWTAPQPLEMLFDTVSDPWEIDNLASQPEYRDRLQRMRRHLKQTMVRNFDSGVIPESLFQQVSGAGSVFDYTHRQDVDIRQLVEFNWFASRGDPESLPRLVASIQHPDPVIRYHALQGLQIQGQAAGPHRQPIQAALADPLPAIRIAAAQALLATGANAAGRAQILAEFEPPYAHSDGVLYQLLNATQAIGAEAEVPGAWVEHVLADPDVGRHIKQFAQQLQERRVEPGVPQPAAMPSPDH